MTSAGKAAYTIKGEQVKFENALGIALAYAAYIEIVVTALVVKCALFKKCVREAVKVVPDWY